MKANKPAKLTYGSILIWVLLRRLWTTRIKAKRRGKSFNPRETWCQKRRVKSRKNSIQPYKNASLIQNSTSSAIKQVKYGTRGCSPESVARLTNASLKRTDSEFLTQSSVIFSKYSCRKTELTIWGTVQGWLVKLHRVNNIPEVLSITHA